MSDRLGEARPSVTGVFSHCAASEMQLKEAILRGTTPGSTHTSGPVSSNVFAAPRGTSRNCKSGINGPGLHRQVSATYLDNKVN